MRVDELILNRIAERPDFPWLVDSAGNAVTGEALRESVCALQRGLAAAGIQAGHRVGLVSPSRPQGLAAALSVLGLRDSG